jgi:hypothetical protein
MPRYRSVLAASAIDPCRFGSAQGVCAELERVETNAGDPLADEAGILTRREAGAAATREQKSPSPRISRRTTVSCHCS